MGSLLCCIPEILKLLTERLWPMAKEPLAEVQVEVKNSEVAICEPLPYELITNIVSRLPADTLYQCANAYRDWNSFFSTRYFIHDLFLPRASPTIILHRRLVVDDELFYLDDIEGDGKITPISIKIKDDPLICGCLTLMFSCFGLLFFAHMYLNYAVVFNPVTRETTYLFLDCEGRPNICGVYYHPIAKEFCVLLVSQFSTNNFVDFKLLREQGPSRNWNTLSSILYLPETKVPPVNLNGALHWMRLDLNPCSHPIILFSIVEEEFKLMPHPAIVPVLNPDGKLIKEMHLFDLNGNLASCQIEDVLEIWTLEDYTSWLWTKTHRIKLEGVIGRCLWVLVLGTQNGALIVHVIGKGTFTFHLHPYTSNIFICHEFKGSRRAKNVCLHTKSLVSFRAFQSSPEKYQELLGTIRKCKLKDEASRMWMEASFKSAQRPCKEYRMTRFLEGVKNHLTYQGLILNWLETLAGLVFLLVFAFARSVFRNNIQMCSTARFGHELFRSCRASKCH